jgi:hypothetical protein
MPSIGIEDFVIGGGISSTVVFVSTTGIAVELLEPPEPHPQKREEIIIKTISFITNPPDYFHILYTCIYE